MTKNSTLWKAITKQKKKNKKKITEYDRLRPLSYHGADVFVLCFSIADRDSLASISQKWVPEVRNFSRKVPLVLVGTKSDLRMDAKYKAAIEKQKTEFGDAKNRGFEMAPPEEAKALCKKINAFCYLECSAKTKSGVSQVFESCLRAAMLAKEREKKKACSMM